MSRPVGCRWILTGELVAESPVHVGSLGAGSASLRHSRDGMDRPLLPATALTGVVRAALRRLHPQRSQRWAPLWGSASNRDSDNLDDNAGAGSWVRIDDAVADAGTVVESREHVSIDRIHGVAARGHLFTREVLAAGSRFGFRMVVDDDGRAEALELVTAITSLLRDYGVAVGGATTKGLGRLRLDQARLRRFDLSSRAGIIDTLRGNATTVDLPARQSLVPAGILRVTIPWQPRGPLMVQVSVDGDVVDGFPLTGVHAGTVRLELPGDTIKGVLRTHAERIARTVTGAALQADFLDQMKADGLGPVAAMFGTAGDRDQGGNQPGWRAALTAYTCVSAAALPQPQWQAVRLLQCRLNDGPAPATALDEHHEALARLQQAVQDLNEGTTGIRFSIAQHVAVDRWTGGAAEGLLFAVLEPHATTEQAWQPMILDLDLDRVEPAATLALLLLLLRDLSDGWVAFGHATTRGMGAVNIDPTCVQFTAGTAAGFAAELHQRSLADVFADRPLIERLSAAWPPSTATATAQVATPESS